MLVDEAHAFRNPDTEQYRALSRLMGGSRKKLALLTATPVNNSFFDLYHQIMLFARHNARFAGVGIPNLTEYFKRAIEAAGHGESSTAMFGLMDAISVRRTRRFIKEHYPNAHIAGKPISFPEPELQTVRYDLDGAYPGLFAQVERDMDALTLARYQPDNYRIDGDADLRAQALAGLLRTGLLKRFESSVLSADGRPGPIDQRAWRYVELGGGDTGNGASPTAGAGAAEETDELEILRRARCTSGTPRDLAGGSAEMLYDLWARVQAGIIEDFHRRLDPAFAAPKIPASHAWALSHLAEQTAELVQAGVPMATIRDADRALAVDRGPIVQRMLSRQRQQLHDGSISPGEAGREIMRVVDEQGLRPIEEENDPPVALTPERVRLVCWQLVHNVS